MNSPFGFSPLNTDPLLVLLRAECETVEEEHEAESLYDQHESYMLAASAKTSIYQFQE